jgi:hypothetical protein
MASWLTAKDVSSAVILNSLLIATLEMASRLSSMTTRVLWSDSSRTSLTSGSSLLFTSSAMRETRSARFTL